MRNQAAFLRQLFALDALLGSRGFPTFSPWWRATLTSFYESGARQAVIRKGRRVGASTIVGPRVAVCEALHGGHQFSPGDRAVFAFISVKRGEAAKRVKNIEAILDALGVPYSTSGETIALKDYPIDFAVLTASYRTAVGDTAIGLWCDEVSRWADVETGANPATQVLASLRPALATLPNARIWLVSSPWGTDDAHAVAFDAGDDEWQRCYHGATWEINPQLSEADCRAMERHEATFLREFGALPSDATTENYFGGSVDLSISKEPIPHYSPREVEFVLAADPKFSQLTNDRFGFCVVASTVGPYDFETRLRVIPRITRVHRVGAWQVDRSPREMATRLRDEVCADYGSNRVLTDQFEGFSWSELARDVGLDVLVVPWTASAKEGSKSDRFSRVRREMYDGQVRIPNDPDFVRELRSVRSVLLPGGGERIEVPRTRSGHGDRVSAYVLATSEALSRRAQLPLSWETFQEEIERKNAEYNFQQKMLTLMGA